MNRCTRCAKPFKPWAIRGVTVEGYGPTCARLANLLPVIKRTAGQAVPVAKRKAIQKRRAARVADDKQMMLELSA